MMDKEMVMVEYQWEWEVDLELVQQGNKMAWATTETVGIDIRHKMEMSVSRNSED